MSILLSTSCSRWQPLTMHLFSEVSYHTFYKDIMTWKGNDRQVGNSSTCATGYILYVEKTGSKLFYQFCPQGFLKMVDDWTLSGSMHGVCLRLLFQTIANHGWFLCGYWLIIDWQIQVPIDWLILLIDIGWSICFLIINFHQLDTPGPLIVWILIFSYENKLNYHNTRGCTLLSSQMPNTLFANYFLIQAVQLWKESVNTMKIHQNWTNNNTYYYSFKKGPSF